MSALKYFLIYIDMLILKIDGIKFMLDVSIKVKTFFTDP